MTVTLVKDQEYNISKNHIALKELKVEIAWSVDEIDTEFSGGGETQELEIDGSIFMLNSFHKIRNENDFVFYNNKEAEDFSVSLLDRPKEGGVSKETFVVKLTEVAFDIVYLALSISIHNAIDLQQSFEEIKSISVTLTDNVTDEVIVEYPVIIADFTASKAITIGEICRVGPEWLFKAGAQGYEGALGDIARDFDVNVRGE